MLEMKRLQRDSISRIYEAHLCHDFSADEVRPLEMILEREKEGNYECYSFLEGHQLVGYMFFAGSNTTNILLLDYFAVVQDKRGLGYGGQMLRQVQSLKSNKAGILLEIEHVDSAKSLEDYTQRMRRREFYIRNGAEETSVQTRVNGVHFAIMFLQKPNGQSTIQVAQELQNLYEDILQGRINYQIWVA